MHDSMMIADVGGIENVSGSRMATPFAPPRPGSTPISTPSRMPTSMNSRFFQVSATAKPCIRFATSSTESPSKCGGPGHRRAVRRGGSVAEQVLERPLGQRDQEPHLEQQEDDDRHAKARRERRQHPELA